MTATIPTREPDAVRVGDTVKFKKHFGDYLPATWTLYYALVKDGNQEIITASDNGDGYHLVNVAPAVTAVWASGTYKYQAYVEDGTDRYSVGFGTLEVKPSFTAEASDTRTHAKKTLDAIEAVIEDRASIDQQSYSIEGRSLSRMPVDELLKLRDRYRAEYKAETRAERIKLGLGTKARILTRFK